MATPPVARIRTFIEKMEAQLAPPPRRRYLWINYGETPEQAIDRHIALHPENRGGDFGMIAWQWDTEQQSAVGRPSKAIRENFPLLAKRTVADPVAETEPAAPPPEPKRPEPEPELEEIVHGFGPRLHYGSSGF